MQQKVNVYDIDGESVIKTLDMPDVFKIEVRRDLVRTVHSLMSLNNRQPYAVSKDAGMQHSAESWGTGRAVSRTPRVKGSGTRRAGQGAFANFCRKGRMAHPTKVTRRWCRKTPLGLRRLVCAMSIAASSNSAIVEARGHRISKLESLPLVLSDKINTITKTKDATALLEKMGLTEDLEKVSNSKTITAGKGKFRGRRYNKRRGVLMVHCGEDLLGFRNVEGIEMMNISEPDILKLAPGGSVGRLIVWTESAFSQLEKIYGKIGGKSMFEKFSLKAPTISVDSLEEYFYSPEIQSLIEIPSLLEKGTCQKSETEIAKTKAYVEMYKAVVSN